jgi:Icc-related predicted phosphoesterase
MTLIRTMREAGLTYLQHESVTITTEKGKSWRVYGSPAAPLYAPGAFQYESKQDGHKLYSSIPADVEILVTHTPPYGVLDQTHRGKKAGCKPLAERLSNLNHCRLHVFGHIHEAYGAKVIAPDSIDGTEQVAVNAAMPNSRKAVVVDLRHC